MVSVSIVTFNTLPKDLDLIFKSFENVVAELKIYIIDNSPTKVLFSYFAGRSNVAYIHNPSNPGFGGAHNIAIQRAISDGAKYHFVVNPDIYFEDDVITSMIDFMQDNPEVGMMMPQILNEDGSIQNLPKLLPSPYSVLMRKFKKPKTAYHNFINNYELRFVKKDLVYNAPILSGCFTLLRLEAIKEIGMYDDNYFMYFEDWDLSRRMHQKYKTIYFPKVSVYHGYHSGANRSKKLFKIFIESAITYFNKWGWLFDRERVEINKKTLKQFK